MQLPHPFIRLPQQFDAGRLRDEVNAIPEQAWNPHPQGFPGNSALLLIARDGNPRDDALSGAMLPTANLQALPYLQQVLASFRTVFGRTRLMRIDGNAEANWHMDANYYWHQRVRLHVPIQTNEAVRFHCGDADVHMRAGEAWIFDTWRMHNVFNPHPDRRIHLVADTTGSSHFWQQVARGLPQPGPDNNWQPDPLTPWQPDLQTELMTERYNVPAVMSPWEMRHLSQRIFSDVVDSNDQVVRQIRQLVEGYINDWHSLWSHYGVDPSAPAYRKCRDGFAEALTRLPDQKLNNGMGLQNMLQQALVYPVLQAKDSDAPSASAPSTPAPAVPASKNASTSLFDRPVFIVAAPRSGSSWLFESLSLSPGLLSLGGEGHGQIESIPALNPKDNQRWHNGLGGDDASDEVIARLQANYLAGLRNHLGEPVKADTPFRFLEKTPKNALRIAFLKKVFPDARFIWLHRDPRENIASIIEAWGSGRFVTYPSLPERPAGWSLLLPPGWQAVKDKPVGEIAAWQWATTNQRIAEQLAEMPRSDWMEISYQQLCQDSNAAIATLCDFIGVVPPQANAAGNLSRHTLTPPAPDKWRKHEQAIMASEAIWASVAERLGHIESTAASAAAITTQDTETMTAPANDQTPAAPETPDFSSVFTNSLAQLLGRGQLSLLVSTYQAGKLIVVRHKDDKVNTHFKLFNKPMGLCGDNNHFAVGTLNRIQEFRNMPAAAQHLPNDQHDAVYVPRQTHVTGDIDIHEMAFDGDNRLWFVNTRFSCLCVRDFDHSFVPMWRPPFVSAYSPEDRCHLNGLAMRDGKPRYVTMLGQTDSKGGWRENKRNGGLLMDISDNRIIATGLSMPHSPRWYRNTLWVLESGEGSLAKVDLASGKLSHVCKLPGFTRGLDFVGDYAFIGLSQVRESAIFSGLPLTEREEPRQCGVWVVDIRNGETVAFLRFEGSVQEIFSVQALPGVRFPEVLEEDHSLVSTCYALPDEALKQVDFSAVERAKAEAAANKEPAA